MTLIDPNYDSSNFKESRKVYRLRSSKQTGPQRLSLNLINCALIIVDLTCVTVASVPLFSREI